ncbi:DUF4357 domain-containing protein [Granulicella tundricola]|uniref:DUF4357 domain-containing protein n=1 Tax=Granulicella tundricola TaxID=940615 RepID=UPI0001DB76BE|nr:DUF4357 domain-containing protein [Granulicella tundricola]
MSKKLENVTNPPRPSLSEAAQANMEQFVDYVLTILPAIRVDGFVVRTRAEPRIQVLPTTVAPKPTAKFLFKLANGQVDASAELENGEFVIQAGSVGRAEWIGVKHNYQNLFDEVIESGVYVSDGMQRRFIKSYAFSSPSAAGAVLSGRATAGPKAWVLTTNPKKTYKEWEAEQLSIADAS